MNENLTAKKAKYLTIAKVLLFLVVLYILSATVVYLRTSLLREQVIEQITQQQSLLVSLSEATARNGADSITESIIKDCSVKERTEFDTLLSSLDKGLSRSELQKLENLFGSCGSFYAERKALMVARLNRELEVYNTHLAHLETLVSNDVSKEYQVETWKTLVDQEKKQSELFSELVQKQSEIISALLSGTSASSAEMKTILQEVRETQELLFLTTRQTAETRSTLIPL